MLAAWTEILPLFVVKWLARRHCDVVRGFAVARPDVLVKLKKKGGE